jgi:PTH1 family peptidyl-tRNA hydrolase
MKLIVGLGNPGREYERTRHNTGFRVVDRLASKYGWSWNEHRAHAMLSSGMIGGEKIILARPLTFMNRSGESVGELLRWYKLQPQDLLVISDEMDLPLGRLRLSRSGKSAGHHGLDDIIRHLHTTDFPRLRIGIGHPRGNHAQGREHVLDIPSLDERIQLEQAEERAVEAIELLITQGIEAAMNSVNPDPQELQRKLEEQQRKKQEREAKQQAEREGPPEQ